MAKEHSYGIILFKDNPRRYLLLLKKSGTDFPKGHPEEGETPEETARRETKEETGLDDIELVTNYREDISFILSKGRKKVFKTVTYFLAKVRSGQVKISSEHRNYKWCDPTEAIKLAFFKEQQELIRKAERILKE